MKKLKIIFALMLVAGLGLNFYYSTIALSDTSDKMFLNPTEIRNSKGNSWSPDDPLNLQKALDDIGSHGTVWTPSRIYLLSSGITIGEYVTLDLCGATLKSTGDFDVVTLKKCASIRNGIIDTQGSGITTPHAAILLIGYIEDHLSDASSIIERMYIINNWNAQQGIGIYLHPTQGRSYHVSAAMVEKNCIIGFEYGIKLYSDPGWVNANMFRLIGTSYNKYFYHIDSNYHGAETPVGCSGNTFSLSFGQPTASMPTKVGFYNNGSSNRFDNMFLWDFHLMEPYGGKSVYFGNHSRASFISWYGGSNNPNYYVNRGGTTNILWPMPSYVPLDWVDLDEGQFESHRDNTLLMASYALIIIGIFGLLFKKGG